MTKVRIPYIPGRVGLLLVAVALSSLPPVARVRPQNPPEVFVQTGHSHPAERLVLSSDGRKLISAEGFQGTKLWDVTSGREVRTLTLEGSVNNIYFPDNDRFFVVLNDRIDVYNTSGIKTGKITIPAVQGYGRRSLTKSGKHLLEITDLPDAARIFDVRDGSLVKLPEQAIDRLNPALLDLGSGLFGVFFNEYDRVREERNIGKTGYVIIDENLQVRKRGVLQGTVGIGGKLRVDGELRFLYELKDFGDTPELIRISLDNGSMVARYPLVQKQMYRSFRVFPDGSVVFGVVVRNETVNFEFFTDVELILLRFLENGLFAERKFLLKELASLDSYVFAPPGLLFASHRDGSIRRYETSGGSPVESYGVKTVVHNAFSRADGRLLNFWQYFSASAREAKLSYNLWNLQTASLDRFNVESRTNDVVQRVDPKSKHPFWHLNDPDRFFAIIPKEFYQDGFDPRTYDGYDRALGYPAAYLKGSATPALFFMMKENYVAALRQSDKSEAARLYAFSNGEWIVITPEGYFNASPGGAKLLNVRVGDAVYSIDNFYEKFYDPARVAAVLQGSKIEAGADLRKGILLPPVVKITSPVSGSVSAAEVVTVVVTARDAGGGVEEIRLYHNGKAVGDDVRGMKVVPKGNEITRQFTVTLVDGINTFRATGFSRDRSESDPFEVTVTLSAPRKEVSMHLLAVGINTYKNPALNLNYAVPDAKGIVKFFRQEGRRLFAGVNVTEVYDDQATRKSVLAGLARLERTNPQDAVVIYLAGHGENINERWYFIPHELTFPEREPEVTSKGISSEDLKEAIRRIRAQKILVLIDACKSGAVMVAFRGFEDRKALAQLSRATGVHVVAASAENQFAAEVKDLGHGVFTYTLLQGLAGKAAAKGESVTVRKLMGYIEEQLPEITKKFKQQAQYPVVDSRGMDFPLAPGR